MWDAPRSPATAHWERMHARLVANNLWEAQCFRNPYLHDERAVRFPHVRLERRHERDGPWPQQLLHVYAKDGNAVAVVGAQQRGPRVRALHHDNCLLRAEHEGLHAPAVLRPLTPLDEQLVHTED
jgi:hypothetical protein